VTTHLALVFRIIFAFLSNSANVLGHIVQVWHTGGWVLTDLGEVVALCILLKEQIGLILTSLDVVDAVRHGSQLGLLAQLLVLEVELEVFHAREKGVLVLSVHLGHLGSIWVIRSSTKGVLNVSIGIGELGDLTSLCVKSALIDLGTGKESNIVGPCSLTFII